MTTPTEAESLATARERWCDCRSSATAYDERMTMDDAFFEKLEAISSDLRTASERLDTLSPNDGSVRLVDPDDTETMKAIALMQDAQRRLTALLATVPG